ncbi:methyl-accepting chemotaxis protein [Thiosulfativibrio zosterae]|uniref:Methyl-accepting transducer domain-containing protein n=1 Tax=Thiosulfativibrio zosterae TaxID=2675053 RepID=A0A6F8PQA3_9GAMM|nr:methyl-accepting chemotaxis protein [Thiosulfativibrio zosterae]BBP44207.1 hypothetical protein THMIRHAT_19530 [Thiosulfativibrio zosterae]
MKLLNYLTINLRLFINTLFSLTFLIAIAYVAWWSLAEVKSKTLEIQQIQQNQTMKLADLQRMLIQTIQNANEYVLESTSNNNQNFNQSIDLLKKLALEIAELTVDDQQKAEIDSLQTMLMEYKKSINSSVYLQGEISRTLKYGIDPAIHKLNTSIMTLTNFNVTVNNPSLTAVLESLVERVKNSQSQVAKLVTSRDVTVLKEFNQKGLGDQSEKDIRVIESLLSSEDDLTEVLERLADSRDGFQESFKDIKDYLVTIKENNQTLIRLVNDANEVMKSVSTSSNQATLNHLSSLTLLSKEQTRWVVVISGMAVLMMLIFNAMLVASITSPLRKVRLRIAEIAETGNLSLWRPLKGKNELVDMSFSIHVLMAEFQQLTDELKMVGQGLSSGDFNVALQQEYHGDLLTLKNEFNDSILQIRSTMSAIQEMSQALRDGRLDFVEDASFYTGDYRKVVASLNAAFAVQKLAIASVKDVMMGMNQGDFSQRIECEMPGDLTLLKDYLNQALHKLEEAIVDKSNTLMHFKQGNFAYKTHGEFDGKLNELRENMDIMANHISRMLSEVQVASSHAVNGVKEISMGNQDLSQRVSAQAISIQSTLNHMEQMIQQVQKTSDNATSVNQKSQEAKKNTVSGADIVNRMFEAIQEIEKTSVDISSFTQVIDDIAFQTNLLALNAAVEAARAGEQGRGFAVVASEVRSLASKSAEAASSIQHLTKHSIEKVKQGIELSRLTKQAFEENASSIDEISSMMDGMQHSLKQQTAGINEVSESLQQINDVTQQNAALVEEVAQTSESIITSVQGVEERLQSFKLRQASEVANDVILHGVVKTA